MFAGVAPEATAQAPLYPFLAQPPPQKQHPTQPLPSLPIHASAVHECPVPGRRRSATIATISAWRAEVHPGSPAACSPRRSPLFCGGRRASYSRRPSLGSTRVDSASYFAITPSLDEHKQHDLTTVGYTSFFVHLPGTPISPEVRRPSIPSSHDAAPAKKNLKPSRSLTSLRPSKRARSRAPPSPPFSPARATAEARRARALSNATIAKEKKSKYTKFRPAPLSNDLALAQFFDGGSMEDNVRRYTRKQAKAAGALKSGGQLVGVGDVWRDGSGGIWRDQDEEMEFAHLLGDDEPMNDWVQFSSPGAVEGERRESVSTQDSDLSPRYALHADADAHDELAQFSQAIKPGLSVLAIPARSRRSAKHLRKPEYLLDAFPIPRSPVSPRAAPSSFFASTKGTRPKGKARRRPAPLTLVPLSPAQVASNPDADDDARVDFFMDSFRPRPRMGRSHLIAPRTATARDVVHALPQKLAAKPSLVNMRGFLKATLGSRKVCAA